MDSRMDVLCAGAMFVIGLATSATYGIGRSLRGRHGSLEEARQQTRPTALPRAASAIALWALSPLVRATIALGVAANTVTALSLVAGAGAGLLLAWGHFGMAALLFATASLGDALDGLVARATGTESVAGALFDASVDRYEEFFAFSGLAIFFRSNGVLLALTLLALVGSFMVSYGSAKAEGLSVRVPPGLMRRAERATYLSLGAALSPIVGALATWLGGPSWAGEVPVVLAVTFIGVWANASAVRRLRDIATAAAARVATAPKIATAREPASRRPAVNASADAE
jgi:CDP-diacylglycerol--glycerol-3-phosphate 3-phosphatidyltransferase